MFVGEVTAETTQEEQEARAAQKAERALPRAGAVPSQGTRSLPPSPRCFWRPRPQAGGRGRVRVREHVCTHRAQMTPDSEAAGPRLPWEQTCAGRGPGCGRAGAYRRAEVAAAGAALVLHHPAPVVFTQHQERRLAGRAHQLVLDHAVGAPAQLQSDNTGQRQPPGGSADVSPGRTSSTRVGSRTHVPRRGRPHDG